MRWNRRSPKGLMNGWLSFKKYFVQDYRRHWGLGMDPGKRAFPRMRLLGFLFLEHLQVTGYSGLLIHSDFWVR